MAEQPQSQPQQPNQSPASPAQPPADQPAATPPQPPKPENVKTYNLTPQETQLLAMLQDTQRQILSIALSFIAGTRLAYPVSPATSFELNDKLNEIKIGELSVPQGGVPHTQPNQPAPPQPPAGSPVKTSQGGQTPGSPAPQQ